MQTKKYITHRLWNFMSPTTTTCTRQTTYKACIILVVIRGFPVHRNLCAPQENIRDDITPRFGAHFSDFGGFIDEHSFFRSW